MTMTEKNFHGLLKELKKGSVVTVTDYSQYKCGQHNTGGSYSYSQSYEKMENGKFKVSHSTSSVFGYCEFCGTFQNWKCSCGEEYEEISMEEVAEIIAYSWKDPNHGVRVKRS